MLTDTTQYTSIVFWLKLMLILSASFLFLVIFQFSYSKKVDTPFSVVTKDVRIGLKYQARETHITGNTYDGGTFDFHAKALNPSHQNDKTVILSKPLGEISLSSEQKFNFSSDFASLNLDEKNILFNDNLSLKNSWGTLIKTEELVADFKKKLLIGPKRITAKSGLGYLSSGRMEYFYSSDLGEEIFFTNGVTVEIFVE